MKPFQKSLAAALVSSAVVFVGCSDKEAATATPEATPAVEKSGPKHAVTGEMLATDQTFIYRALDEHSSLDPAIIEDVSGSEHARNLFEGLLNQDADGNLIPGVAERFEASEDKKTYTFFLRKDAKWSNGDPVTASDFVYSWQRAADPATASPYSWYVELTQIENVAAIVAGEAEPSTLGVRAVDDYTFEVKLADSLPYFAQMVAHTTMFPVHKATVEAHGEQWTKAENMVSNGAYKLVEHVVNERVELARNTNYWNNDATILEKVVALVIPDDNQALIRWKAGEVDKTEVPSGQYMTLKGEMPENVVTYPKLCSYYYHINIQENGPEYLKDARVRQALSYAIDRNVITENILQAGQSPAYTFTPEATAGFSVPNVEIANMTQAERNEKAKALLAEAGYAEGLDVEILYNTSEGHKTIATAISQMWKTTLGVNAQLKNLEWKTYLTEKPAGNFEVARAGWCGDYNEASTFLDLVHSKNGNNDAGYDNPEVDQLLEEARTMADPSENYAKIEEAIARDVPLIPIYHYVGSFMLNTAVKGWPVNNVQENWYAKDLYKVAQ